MRSVYVVFMQHYCKCYGRGMLCGFFVHDVLVQLLNLGSRLVLPVLLATVYIFSVYIYSERQIAKTFS